MWTSKAIIKPLTFVALPRGLWFTASPPTSIAPVSGVGVGGRERVRAEVSGVGVGGRISRVDGRARRGDEEEDGGGEEVHGDGVAMALKAG